MHEGFRIGRVFGVRLAIDYSWIFVFLLMAWNLTAAFVRWHPEWTSLESLALAVVATVLFFASILAHELAHTIVARAFDIPVSEIRLFLFGGISNIEREPASARAELWMALVGPVTSAAIGFFLLTIASPFVPRVDAAVDATQSSELLAGLGPVTTVLVWLGTVNVALGIFNLIPGFPLDGGRVLRAAIWSWTRDLERATFWASSIGQGIGWLFMLMGLAMLFGTRIPFFGQGAVAGLWLAFIGWFLRSASERSYRGLLVQDMLDGVRVTHLMRHRGYVLPASTTIDAAVNDWFMRSNERAFPVVDGGRFVGLLSVADLRKIAKDDWPATPVTAIMTPADQLTVASPLEEATSALRKISQLDIEQLPVVDRGQLVGMLDRSDVARWIEVRLGAHPPTPRHA